MKTITRIFTYNGIEIDDPDPTREPGKIPELLELTYPDMINAKVEPKGIIEGRQYFEISTSIGKHG